MADTSIYAGYVPQPGRWHSGVKLGGVNTPPVEFELDKNLPDLGRDPLYPNRDYIVIPRGRVVAAKALDLTYLGGKTLVTLANGVDPLNAPSFATGTIPFGYCPFNLYRSFSGLPADKPLGVKHETIEVPYTSVNESYNNVLDSSARLKVGEWVMPYYGATYSTTPVPQDKGKLVRWIPRKVYQTTAGSASGTVLLSSAPFPAMKPRVLLAFTSAGVPVVSGTTALSYSEADHSWKATFGTSVTTVVYEYGAGDDQKIGQVMGVEPVGTAGGLNGTNHEMTGWLKWITDNFSGWDWPPVMNVRPTNSVTNEVVTVTNGTGQLANYPIVPFRTISVVVSGTLTKSDGTTQTLAGDTLETADTLFFNDQSQGKYYDVDFLTGTIRFASNLTVTACTVSYYYENAFRDGLKWDSGILGLTDGLNSGIVGLPPHLDVAGVKGVLRVMIL